MKPLKLILEAFGAFAKKTEIDFERLGDGVFLLTGDTGSGKTTVFDGITFALYGEPSGSNRKAAMLRSDYAAPSQPTRVILEFSYGSSRYRIERTPAYERPKLKGTGTVLSPAEASIWNDRGEVITTGNTNVTEKVTDIMGVNREQFINVSMIAQGEFLKLLLAKSADRADIFRSIFNTGVYRRLQQLLTDKSKLIYAQLTQCRNSILQYAADGCINSYSEEDEEAKNNVLAMLGESNIYCMPEYTRLIGLTIDGDKKEQSRLDGELISLRKKQEKAIAKLAGDKARSDQYNAVKKAYDKDIRDREMLIPSIDRAKLLLEEKESRLPEIKKLNASAAALENTFPMYDSLTELMEDRKKVLAVLSQQESRLSELRNNQERYRKKAAEYQSEVTKKTEEYELQKQKRQENSDLYEQYLEGFLRGQAGIMAARLNDGIPCPVCGSTTHPHKQEPLAEVCTEEELNLMKQKRDAAEAKLFTTTKSLGELRDRVWEEQRKAEELQQAIEQQTKLCSDKSEEAARLCTTISMVSEQLEFSGIDEAKRVHDEYLELAGKLERDRKQAEDKLAELKNDIVFLDKSIEKNSEWLHNNKSMAVDTTEAEAVLARYNLELKELEKNKTAIEIRLVNNQNVLVSISDKQREYDEYVKSYEVYHSLADTANGGGYGKGKFSFESYVQATYFEQVIGLANERLLVMTGGRFKLIRRTEANARNSQTGLEIDVLDKNTGKVRKGETLSGGEAFMASLALALGMSDIISASSGGIRMDSMFIDEGFGSLDQDSLEQALSILNQLGESRTGGDTNRMIGIISHVDALKDRIDRKIIVERGIKGSRIIQK